MSIVKYNIGLQKQVNHSFSKTMPENKTLAGFNASVDGSEYEEFTFTGCKTEIDAQEQLELGKADFKPYTGTAAEAKQVEVGTSVTTTKTRSEGEIWTLTVRVCKIMQTLEVATDEEKQQQQEQKFGSQKHPKIVNTSVTAIQQSIMFREPYKSWSAEQLGALRQYMSGASPLTRIPKGVDSSGNAQNAFLQDILPYDDKVKAAIKTPVYYVPSVNVTVSYWSSSPVTSIGTIGQEKAPSGGNFQIANGYTSVFMGASSSPAEGGGYTIQETYSIGQYDADMLASSGSTSGGGSGSTN